MFAQSGTLQAWGYSLKPHARPVGLRPTTMVSTGNVAVPHMTASKVVDVGLVWSIPTAMVERKRVLSGHSNGPKTGDMMYWKLEIE